MTLPAIQRPTATGMTKTRLLRQVVAGFVLAFGLVFAGSPGSGGGIVKAGDDIRFPMTGDQAAYWRFVTDGVMGGVSSGRLTFERQDGVEFARLAGTVSTENNGGFIQLPDGGAGLTGIRITSRGNGETYFIHLRTRDNRRPWHYYAAAFTAGDDWRQATLPFDSFRHSAGMTPPTPSPQDIISVGIVAYGRDHRADVSVSEIGFY